MQYQDKYMLFAGREVRIEKNCSLSLCKDLDLWLRPYARPQAQFFSIRTSGPANNIYLSWVECCMVLFFYCFCPLSAI